MSNVIDIIELKKIEIELFKEFIKICDKHNLNWFVLGGTCLGAVRHQGFIPWDDDIDVGMPRDHYEKFLNIAPKEFPSFIFVQSCHSDPDFPANFAKLRNSNTTFIETSMEKLRINHGVYLDIFPLDGYKKSKRFEFFNALYSKRIGYAFNMPHRSRSIVEKLKKALIVICLPSVKKTVLKRDKLLSSFDFYSSDYIANYCGAWGKKEIVPRACFGDGVKGIFEGIAVNLPTDYNMYLCSLYGDYMKLPPEDKRVTHHYTTIVDLHKSYIDYQ